MIKIHWKCFHAFYNSGQESGLRIYSSSAFVPIYILPEPRSPPTFPTAHNQITLCLTLAFSDVQRSLILLSSLYRYFPPSLVHRLVVIVPDQHYYLFSPWFHSSLPFPTLLLKDSDLFSDAESFEITRRGWSNYAVQMALKLLVSKVITTEFYLTLDADVILTRPVGIEDLIRGGKGAFSDER